MLGSRLMPGVAVVHLLAFRLSPKAVLGEGYRLGMEALQVIGLDDWNGAASPRGRPREMTTTTTTMGFQAYLLA